ncbi:uncharacterized protein LOC105844828 [Hydra vulgaris]|uniref:uncharacterized protein LOC105844828 n=1 Tax=Hydra vulgaris TaxID=6087 RepID=UPI000640E6CE|nr:uncharacterized protein LOC105844828 [Hydra vulgaris]
MHSGWLCAADKKKPRSFKKNLKKSNVLTELPIPIINHKFMKQTKILSFFKTIHKTSKKNKEMCLNSTLDCINTNAIDSSTTGTCIKYINREYVCNTSLKESVIHISDSPVRIQCTYSDDSVLESTDFQNSSVDCINEDFSPCILTTSERFQKLVSNGEYQPPYQAPKINNEFFDQSFYFINNKTIKKFADNNNYENVPVKSFDDIGNMECNENSLTLNPPSPIVFTEQFSECLLNDVQSQPPSPLFFTESYNSCFS